MMLDPEQRWTGPLRNDRPAVGHDRSVTNDQAIGEPEDMIDRGNIAQPVVGPSRLIGFNA